MATTEAEFPLTRAAALARLRAFVPQAGADYARLRNLDLGPGRHGHVSRLSAALRRRLVSEAEVISAALAAHGPAAASSFLSEVFWRSYWKGWLEHRPAVWTGYVRALADARADLARDPASQARHDAACAGRTGIDAFDHWIGELRDTGYLHNWARVQVASIWVFTLGLRWELGAALTLGQFTDADPASNTLSWRWVAGLHTAGKAYLADAERIHAMTGGRFTPRGLARTARLPADSLAVPPPMPPRMPCAPDAGQPSLLLITPEDLSPETEPALRRLPVRAIAALPGVTAADRVALADALARAGAQWGCDPVTVPGTAALIALAQAAGARQIVTAFLPVGPEADRLSTLPGAAQAAGLQFAEHLRAWDARVWPHCRKGFFALKDQIPALLRQGEVADA